MNFLKFNQKMNLEIDKRMNSAWAEFGPWCQRACSRRRHRAHEWRGDTAMGGGTAAPAALSRRHEHEGSQEKAPGKVVMAALAWRQGKARGGGEGEGGPATGPTQCEQFYFWFIQTILNCPEFESTKWRTLQTQKISNKIWFWRFEMMNNFPYWNFSKFGVGFELENQRRL
jgi:hypothetical protein